MNPLVTVIVLVNNEQYNYVEETIKSVLQQTDNRFVVYICYSGSTADTLKAVEPHLHSHPLITVSGHNKDAPLSAVIEATQTQYFGWLNSGDVLRPTALKELIAAMASDPDIGVAYTNQSTFESDSSLSENATSPGISYSKEKLLTGFIVTQFRLIRRSTYEKAGGINERLPYCKAYDLILKLSEISSVSHVDKHLCICRKDNNKIDHNEQIARILWSREVANQALQRRGLSSEYKIVIELLPRCCLEDKLLPSIESE